MRKLFSVLAIAAISFSTVQAQEVAPTKKPHSKSKKTTEVAKKETTPEKQGEAKTVTSAEANKKEASNKHKENKAK